MHTHTHTHTRVLTIRKAQRAEVRRCEHTSAYLSIREHTHNQKAQAAKVSSLVVIKFLRQIAAVQHCSIRQHTSAYVSMRQHTSEYVSIRQHTSACVSIRKHTCLNGKSSMPSFPSRISCSWYLCVCVCVYPVYLLY